MPTGRFVHVAKANGFSSVSDMLHLHSEETGIAGTDPEKQEASKKVFTVLFFIFAET